MKYHEVMITSGLWQLCIVRLAPASPSRFRESVFLAFGPVGAGFWYTVGQDTSWCLFQPGRSCVYLSAS